jgi:sulfoxide reductase heme-binding subunit YedZ
MYAAIHLLIFTGLDYAFDVQQLLQIVTEKPYIIVGLISFLGLTVLAITSFRKWQMRLKKNWKRLHQMVYAINLLVVLHFAWSVKGNLFKLQGDIYRPFLAALAVVTLLVLRLPAVRRSIAGQYQRKPAENSRPTLKHDNPERDEAVGRDRQTIRDETAAR